MVYIRDNLARRSERQSHQQPREKKATEQAILPIREKLLYLSTVLFCSAVALFLISRYAHIYYTNLNVHEIKRKTAALRNEVSELTVQKEKLSDWQRIEEIAKREGLIRPPEISAEIEGYKQGAGN